MAKRWYSVSVLSNFEKKIAEIIRTSVAENGLEIEIDEVLVPTEEVIEVRRGKKVTTERRFMPGYVLVHMEMSDQGYHLINSINRVTGFLGPQGRPMPMRDAEVNQILNRVQEGEDSPRTLIHFEVGEKVKVNDGPFEDFDGMVEEVDDESQRLKVMVSIFGLIDFKYPRQLWKKNREESVAFIVTFVITMTVGIPQGILFGVLLSLLTMIYRTSRPHIAILGKIKHTEYYKNINRFQKDIEVDDRMLILRFDAQLFFGNQDYFKKELQKHVAHKGKNLELIIINAEAINYIDSSALNMLEKVCTDLKETGLQIMMVGAIGPIRDIIYDHALIQIIGSENLFIKTSEAVNTFLEGTVVTAIQKKITHQNLTVTNVTKNIEKEY